MKGALSLKTNGIRIFDLFLNLYFAFLVTLFLTDYSFVLLGLHNKFNFLPDGIANISTQAAPFVVILFIRWFLDKGSFATIKFINIVRRILSLNDRVILLYIFFIFVFIFLSIGIARHFALSSSGRDLAVSDQSLWNTTRGDILFCSLDGNISHLGAHFEPVLFFIVPLYFIWPSAVVLIFLQSFFLGLAIFPLYFIAKTRLNERLLVFAFILAYFLSRPIRGVGLLDFHTDSFLVPLIFFSYYFLVTKRTKLALFSLFLMLLCKEDAAFLVGALGVFVLFFQKRYKLGVFLIVASVSCWLFATNIIMPHFAKVKDYPYLSLLPFADTYSGNAKAVLENPLLLKELFFSPVKIDFYARLFAPLCFLSFLSPPHYILFLVPLLEHVIGSLKHVGMQTITSHYPAHTLPFIFISAIYGVGWLLSCIPKKGKAAISLSICIVFFSLLFYGKTDGYKFSKFLKGAQEIKAQELIYYLKLIPKDASVYAPDRLVPHLSHRKYIYLWEGMDSFKYPASYIVLHKDLLELNEEKMQALLGVLSQKGYKEVFSQDNSFYILFNNKAGK